MCGRFGRSSNLDAIQAYLDSLPRISEVDWSTTYNAAPGVEHPIVRVKPNGAESTIRSVLWGLIPFWSESPSSGPRPINAKAETASTAPMFRKLIRERRCLVPADWFYEWKVTSAGKIPYCIRTASGEPFFFAGLWDIWHPRQEDALRSFTILTTEPNELTARIHNRMPVIVRPEDYARWLDPTVRQPEKLSDILTPYPAEEMITYPVTTLVNNVKSDGPELTEPWEGQTF